MATTSTGGSSPRPVHLGLDQTETVVTEVTAGLAVTPLIGGDPDRLELVVLNLGGNDVFISPLTDVSTTKGIRLAANGGQFILQRFYDHSLTGWGLYCVSAAATSGLFVMAVRRYGSD